MKKWIGIDVGKSGGIAVLSEDNSLELFQIPTIGAKKIIDVKQIYSILERFSGPETIYAIEDVHSIPGTGAGANFSFGECKGLKIGILESLKVRYVLVAPKTWQAIAWQGIPMMKKPNKKTDTKGMSMLAANRLFPTETFLATNRSSVPHDGLIDAALISYYLKTQNR